MKNQLVMLIGAFSLVFTAGLFFHTMKLAAQPPLPTAVFTADGKLKLPAGYRRWVFVGAPLTPNALNGGEANFPEFHHVYVEARNLDAYLKNGTFPEGTVFIKELTRVLKPEFPEIGRASRRERV